MNHEDWTLELGKPVSVILQTDVGEETVTYDLSTSDFDLTEEELMEIQRISQVAYLPASDDDEVRCTV